MLKIYGAGLAGLLAANLLRRLDPVIFEAKQNLTSNHQAVLRFRSDSISRALRIPFQEITVQKAISYKGKIFDSSNLFLNNLYSLKVSGQVNVRSIMNLNMGKRWIAPPDFIEQMSKNIPINFNSRMTPDVCISTIPMPILMGIVGWENKPEFQYQSITVIRCKIESPKVDAYQTIYYPSKTDVFYRISLSGSEVIAEMVGGSGPKDMEGVEDVIRRSLYGEFGIDEVHFNKREIFHQPFGKILPIDESKRQNFIYAMTEAHGIYSLGRFATWRSLLLDDLLPDIHKIELMFQQRNSYNSRLQRSQT